MRDEHGALHVEVLSAIPGRLRLALEKPITNEVPFLKVEGVRACRYNPAFRRSCAITTRGR